MTSETQPGNGTAGEHILLKVAAFGTLAVMAVLFCNEWLGSGNGATSEGSCAPPTSTNQRRCLQALALWQIVIDLSESSFVVPFAYDFAKSLSGSGFSSPGIAFLSGVIQAGSPAGMTFGLFVAYWLCRMNVYKLSRILMALAPLLTALVYVSLSYLLLFHESYRHLGYLVITARFVAGFCSGLDLLLSTLARDITKESEQVAFSLLEYMALSGGLALGPLVSSVASSSLGAGSSGRYSQEIRASCAVSILYAVLALCISCCVPMSEPQKSTSDSEGSEGSSESESNVWQAWALPIGSACVFLGIFSCAAVEVSSSLLLELNYAWDVLAIGQAMAAVYVAVIFLCAVFLGLETCVSSKYMVVASSLGMLGGVVLLFDIGTGGATQLLLADLVMYPCITVLVAIVDGYVYIGRHEFISTEGLNLAMYVIDSIARALAAPIVRSIIASKGRNAYASLQCGAAVLLVFLAIGLSWMRDCKRECEDSAGSMGLIQGGWFIEKNSDWPGLAVAIEVKDVLLHAQTAVQEMLVFQSTHWGNVLVLDGAIMCTERDEMSYQEMLAHLAMFSHANPCKVLIVGGGDGGVLREVCKHTCVQSAVLCEIDAEVVDAAKRFFPGMACAFGDSRASICICDAVKHLEAACDSSYDVIIIDSSDPVGPAEKLFSREFYGHVHRSLRPGGIVCAQGESVWFDMELICSMVTENGAPFATAEYASIQIPTYVGGQIGAFIARKSDPSQPGGGPPSCSEPLRRPADMALRYYTPELHEAAFRLPAFVKKELVAFASPVTCPARTLVPAAEAVLRSSA